MSRFKCEKCGTPVQGIALAGRCKNCGATYRATFQSKMVLYAALFFGFLFGPMIVRPFLLGQGIEPQSITATLVPLMGGISVMLILGALSVRFLKFDWKS